MLDYILKKVLQTIFVVTIALTVVFFLIRLSGDPVLLFLPPDASYEQIEEYRERLGFNRPLHVQYSDFISKAIQGDFGKSLRTKEDALDMIVQRLPATFILALSAVFISVIIAVPIGVLSAYKKGSIFDQISVGITVLGQAVPGFWLGLILIFIFAAKLKVLPSGGSGTIKHIILPAITLSSFSLARFSRFTRSTMLDVLQEDYVRTARSSGVPMLKVLFKYALKNTLIPIITLIGLDLGVLLGGSVIIEAVFAWPGIGQLLMQSLRSRDFSVVLAGVFFIALIYSIINFVTDVLYGYVNPQIRYK